MLFTGLTLIFVACKLFGVVEWSWCMCFLPTIIHILIYLIAVIIEVSGRSEK